MKPLIATITDLSGATDAPGTLILFPYGGGSPLDFRAWKDVPVPGRRTAVLQYPGHGADFGGALAQNMDELVDAVIAPVRRAMTGCTVFLGHSLGAVTAYETAVRLTAEGRPPSHLFVSGLAAPHLPRRNTPIAHLSDAAFDRALIAYGGLPDVVTGDPALMDFIRPVQRAAFRLWENHVHRAHPPLACPITGLAGDRDSHYPAEDVRAWADYTTTSFAFHELSGGHIFLHDHKETIRDMVARVNPLPHR